mgnify:CR=1 FL=1
MSSTLFDIHEMLLDVIRRAREIIPFDSGGLIPYDPIKQTLVPTPDLYLSDGVNTLVPIRLGMGVIGQVAQKRKPEMVNDMENDPRRQYLDTRSRSELAVPVLLEDKLLGVFNVESREPGAYDDVHLRVLQMLADQTALVIHTFRRYQDLSENYTDLVHEMDPHPACIAAGTFDLLVWNRTFELLYLAHDHPRPFGPNALWEAFSDPTFYERVDDWENDQATLVARFRFEWGRQPGNPRFAELVEALHDLNPKFTELWSAARVQPAPRHTMTCRHPMFGLLSFRKVQLRVADEPGLALTIQRAADESTAHALSRLSATGRHTASVDVAADSRH